MGQNHDEEHHVPELDKATGVYTTGHAWDGIKELNNPLPRWWIIGFWSAIVLALVYSVLYPAWPGVEDYTKGILKTSARVDVHAAVEKAKAEMKPMMDKIEKTPLQDISKDPDLQNFTLLAGEKAFAANCAACHGSGGGGAVGFPNLRDDEWLWGGSLEQIYHTINYGIRNENSDSRQSLMPAFGKDELLTTQQIKDVTEYVMKLSGEPQVNTALASKGQAVFDANCVACHGDKGQGDQAVGAPRLSNQLWLYKGDRQSVMNQIFEPRHGAMPVWSERLDGATIKMLAVYVYSMSGQN